MKRLQLILFSFLMILKVFGHGGDEHSDAPKAHAGGRDYFSISSVSDKFELVLRYGSIEIGKSASMKLFVSDFETNAPIDKARIDIRALEDPGLKFGVTQLEPGIYSVKGQFPSGKPYSLALNIVAADGRADLMTLKPVEPGKELPHAEEEHETGLSWLIFLWVGGAFICGVLLTMVLTRRKAGKTFTFLLILSLMLPVQLNHKAFAHGDEHSSGKDQKSAGSATDEMEVLKEAQFLYSMRTRLSGYSNYSGVLKLYGKVIPDIGGFSEISVPESGFISSLKVRVGENVQKGQALAVFEQTLSATDQVDYNTARNNAAAELESARKDYERLKKIEDIAAKKDLQQARIRYENAQKNLENFSGGRKTFTITSPINGQVDNFSLTVGSPIQAGQPIFRIVNTARVRIEAQVFDRDLHKIPGNAGFLVECVQENHKTEKAELVSFGNVVNPANQSSQIILEVSNDEDLFKIGQFASVYVMTKSDTAQLTVPASALSDINGKPVVFTHVAPELFKVNYVSTGLNNSEQVIILKGLQPAERIVTSGAYQLKSIFMNQ